VVCRYPKQLRGTVWDSLTPGYSIVLCQRFRPVPVPKRALNRGLTHRISPSIITRMIRAKNEEGSAIPSYRVYIDEVGNADLESSHDPNHRFLSLTGVIVDWQYVKMVLHPQMEALKQRYFSPHPDSSPLIFHRKDLMNANYPFKALREDRLRKRFDEDLLAHLSSWEYVVITVCIDKKRHKEMYNVWTYDPYHYC